MKKRLLSLLLIFSTLLSFSQTIVTPVGGPVPGFQQVSSATTQYHINGMVYPHVGFINARYTDTTAANSNPYIKWWPGAQIMTGNRVWIRNSTATAWIELAAGSGVGTVTSVGLQMPPAFNVANSPVTNAGTFIVTGAGTINQYIRGDGTLATFPSTKICNPTTTILNDSTIIICSCPDNICDTIPLCNTIPNLNNVYFLTDSTIVVCGTDPVTQVTVCDTCAIPTQDINVYQNWLTSPSPGIVEAGGFLKHTTTFHTLWDRATFTGHPVHNYTIGFEQQQAFPTGTGVVSFRHYGSWDPTEIDYQNTVKLGVNYTGATYPFGGGPGPAYMNGKIGYMLNVNGTGVGPFGFEIDNPQSKFGGIFFHTLDTAFTDAITFFASAPPLANSAWNMQGTTMDSLRAMIIHHNKNITLLGYDSTTRNDGVLSKVLGTDADGDVILGTVQTGLTSVPTWQQTLAVTSGSILTQNNTITGGGFDWTWNNTGNQLIKLAATKRFIVEDQATGINQLEIRDDRMQYYTSSATGFNTGELFVKQNDAYIQTNDSSAVGGVNSYLVGVGFSTLTDGRGVLLQSLKFDAALGNPFSMINLKGDSLVFKIWQGKINFDTIRAATSENTLIGWKQGGAHQGGIGYITIGTGLSLASGVLSSTAITNITADNGLTEDVANNIQFGSSSSTGSPLLHHTFLYGASSFTMNLNDVRFEPDMGASVASANDLTLGMDGNTFPITGTTQVNAITTANWQNGSEITLVFNAATTVKHNTSGGAGTAPILLAGSTDLVTDANTVLTLVLTGSQWEEKSRKMSGSVGPYAFSNGVVESPAGVVKWGGTSTENRTWSTGAFTATITGTVTPGPTGVFSVTNSNAAGSGNAIVATVVGSGHGVASSAATGSSFSGFSSGTNSATGQFQNTGGGFAGRFIGNGSSGVIWAEQNSSSTNTVVPFGLLYRLTSGTAAAGIGGSLDLGIEKDNGTTATANQIIWKYTNAAAAGPTSQMIFTSVNAGTLQNIVTLDGGGQVTFDQYTGTNFNTAQAKVAMVGTDGKVYAVDTTGLFGGGGGGPVTWNAILSPTGVQSLTFADTEISTWANENDTETFLDITNNSLTTGKVIRTTSSSITTGNQIEIISTSTALAAGNEGLNIDISGANGTNAITATGARISVTNTNATSGTNIALSLNASGATTQNTALSVGDGAGWVGIGIATPAVLLHVNRSDRNISDVVNINSGSVFGNTVTMNGTALTGNKSVSTTYNAQTINLTANQTIPNGTDVTAGFNVMTINNSSAFTLTMTQGSLGTIRALSATKSAFSVGSFNAASVITHAANFHVEGFQAPTTTGTVTNYYGLLIEDQKVNAATWVFTNRWGIYQEGPLDRNFFAGKSGFGITPTAQIHTAAHTTAANSAPIKLTSGTAMTTPEDGALEYHSSHLYFTIGSTRFQLDQQSGVGTLDLSYDATNHEIDITGGGTSAIVPLAVDDGATEGLASFTAADFNASSGNISIDYTNGQKATTSTIGFLTDTDWDTFNDKQAALVSGTNIKTINGSSILGSGDLVVSGSITGADTRVVFFDGTDNPAGDGGMTYNKTTDALTIVGDFSMGDDFTMTNGTVINETDIPGYTVIRALNNGIAHYKSGTRARERWYSEAGAYVMFEISFDGSPIWDLSATGERYLFNGSQQNEDFEISGDGTANLFRTDASQNEVHIGDVTDLGSYKFQVHGSSITDGNIKATGFIELSEIATPSTPGTALGRIYQKADGFFYGIDDAGTETMLSNTGGSGLTVGTTSISSGSNTNILYNNSGVLGEYTITGTGTVVVMQNSPTLTTPRIANGGYIADANGNELMIYTTTASAVNEITFANAATGNNPKWTASGETNVGMDWQVKGTGVYRFLATASGPTDIRLFEDTDNGTNFNSFIAPASMASDFVQTLPGTTGTLLNDNNTVTVTNKRITKRTGTVASSATPTINTDNVDLFTITAQTVDITSMTTNLSGTPTTGDELEIWITGTATRAITWGASFAASTIALPTSTSGTATLRVKFVRNGSTWVIVGVA